MNKLVKKGSVLALAMLMLTASLFVFGAWTFAPEETVEAQAMSAGEEGIVPYGGGQGSLAIEFDDQIINVSVTAENYWWPMADKLQLSVNSSALQDYAKQCKFVFSTQFVWTNSTKSCTYFSAEKKVGETTIRIYPLKASLEDITNLGISLNSGFVYNNTIKCNANENYGNVGDFWACEYINFYIAIECDGVVKTGKLLEIHF